MNFEKFIVIPVVPGFCLCLAGFCTECDTFGVHPGADDDAVVLKLAK